MLYLFWSPHGITRTFSNLDEIRSPPRAPRPNLTVTIAVASPRYDGSHRRSHVNLRIEKRGNRIRYREEDLSPPQCLASKNISNDLRSAASPLSSLIREEFGASNLFSFLPFDRNSLHYVLEFFSPYFGESASVWILEIKFTFAVLKVGFLVVWNLSFGMFSNSCSLICFS